MPTAGRASGRPRPARSARNGRGEAVTVALVLGVHRSGTSLLTSGLAAAGGYLGDVVTNRDQDNPEGYFEHPDVRQFSERVFTRLGGSWDNWGLHAPALGLDGPGFADLRAEAGTRVRQIAEAAGGRVTVLKDPRVATLLPFWEAAIAEAGLTVRRVLIVRDPAEVAESQRQRAMRNPAFAPIIAEVEPMAALWAVTMHGLLMSLRDDATLLVRHDDLYADPVGTLAAAAGFLGLVPAPGALGAFVDRTFHPELRRARPPAGHAEAAKGRPDWLALARRLFVALSRGAPGARPLTASAARDIARAQRALADRMPLLHAVRASLARLGHPPPEVRERNRLVASREDQAVAQALRHFVWTLSGRIGWPPDHPFLSELHARVTALLPQMAADAAVLVALARLELHMGRPEEARGRLEAAVAALPDHPVAPRILATLPPRAPRPDPGE